MLSLHYFSMYGYAVHVKRFIVDRKSTEPRTQYDLQIDREFTF
jgi:hypothetical protein